MRVLRSLKALVASIIAGYVLPFGALRLAMLITAKQGLAYRVDNRVTSIDLVLGWTAAALLLFCPIFSGYLAARFAPSHPLYHALAAPLALAIAWAAVNPDKEPLFLLAVASGIVGLGLIGGLGAKRIHASAL